MIENIYSGEDLIAIIIPCDYKAEGIEFFTPDDYSQQLAYMNRPAGYQIEPHIHKQIQRKVIHTQEVLFIRSGKIQVNLYDSRKKFIKSRILGAGDVIMLASGGHGFDVIEDTEMIEVKQGPYAGENDKVFLKDIP